MVGHQGQDLRRSRWSFKRVELARQMPRERAMVPADEHSLTLERAWVMIAGKSLSKPTAQLRLNHETQVGRSAAQVARS
jgi:hypothetical protein